MLAGGLASAFLLDRFHRESLAGESPAVASPKSQQKPRQDILAGRHVGEWGGQGVSSGTEGNEASEGMCQDD